MHTAIPAHPNQLKHAASHAVALAALGNPLRGDDAIGSYLLAGLPVQLRAGLCTLDAGSYTRDLPEFLHGHKVGIIVDAAESTGGELVVFDLSDMTQSHNVSLDCSHALSWLDEIVLYQKEFAIPKHLLFVAVPTYDTGWHEGLSQALQVKLPQLVKQLCQLIEPEREDSDYA
jgi:hydrogenase maturation protease